MPAMGDSPSASAIGPLDPTDDLDAMAKAAWRLGHAKESIRIAELVFGQTRAKGPDGRGDEGRGGGVEWFTRGDVNIGQGWMNRARRLLDDAPAVRRTATSRTWTPFVAVFTGTSTSSPNAPRRCARSVRRSTIPSLTSLCTRGAGLAALLRAGCATGTPSIDEAILPLLADEVPVEWAGDIYCVVLHLVTSSPTYHGCGPGRSRWSGGATSRGSATYCRVCDVHRLAACMDGTDDYRQLEDRLSHRQCGLEPINGFAAAEGLLPIGRGAQAARRRRGCAGGVRQDARARRRTAARRGAAAVRAGRQAGRMERPASSAGRKARHRQNAHAARRHPHRVGPRPASTRPKVIVGNWKPEPRRLDTPGFKAWAAHARGAVLVRRGDFEAALGSLRRRYRNTGRSNAGTRRQRSTSGWHWRTAGSVMTPPRLPTWPPQ